MTNDFSRGAYSLLTGFGLITRPGLRRYVIIPLLINSVLFAGLIWLLGDEYQRLLAHLLPELPSWLQWLSWLLWLLFVVLTLLIVFYTFTLVANLIGAPFNQVLSARVEQLLTGSRPPESGKSIWREIAASIYTEVRKLVYFLGIMLAAGLIGLVLLFVPVVNTLVPVLWFIVGAWMLAVEYADYPLGNHGLDFIRQRELLRRYRMRSLGFGAVAALVTLIPIVNFLVMPAAVAGATVLWTDLPELPGKTPSHSHHERWST